MHTTFAVGQKSSETDFWGDLPGFMPDSCSPGDDCHEPAPRGSKTGTQGLASSADRALMPRALSDYIKHCATTALSDTPTGTPSPPTPPLETPRPARSRRRNPRSRIVSTVAPHRTLDRSAAVANSSSNHSSTDAHASTDTTPPRLRAPTARSKPSHQPTATSSLLHPTAIGTTPMNFPTTSPTPEA